jgi:hypothetical protein
MPCHSKRLGHKTPFSLKNVLKKENVQKRGRGVVSHIIIIPK